MTRKPLCIDLFCGLGGWTEGFLAEGSDVIGFDIEQHVYGEHRYPAQLVLQDVLTIHGKQFRDASMIVASSPCQAYSYMAMPWTRAKQIAKALRGEGDFPEAYTGYRTIEALNALFEAPKRIQREASEAAGRHIPMVQENVRGAIPWVGRSQWNFGSFHLWGDVPALMPITMKRVLKAGVTHRANGETNFHGSAARASEGTKSSAGSWDRTRANYTKDHSWKPPEPRQISAAWRDKHYEESEKFAHQKNGGGSRFNIGSPGQKVTGQNPVTQRAKAAAAVVEGKKGVGIGSASWQDAENRHPNDPRNFASKSKARKAASAAIAKIPFPLASHIARVYYPDTSRGGSHA